MTVVVRYLAVLALIVCACGSTPAAQCDTHGPSIGIDKPVMPHGPAPTPPMQHQPEIRQLVLTPTLDLSFKATVTSDPTPPESRFAYPLAETLVDFHTLRIYVRYLPRDPTSA